MAGLWPRGVPAPQGRRRASVTEVEGGPPGSTGLSPGEQPVSGGQAGRASPHSDPVLMAMLRFGLPHPRAAVQSHRVSGFVAVVPPGGPPTPSRARGTVSTICLSAPALWSSPLQRAWAPRPCVCPLLRTGPAWGPPAPSLCHSAGQLQLHRLAVSPAAEHSLPLSFLAVSRTVFLVLRPRG